MDAFGKRRRELGNKLGELQSPPEVAPEPNPDAVEMVPAYRDASGVQYAPRHVVESMREAKRLGLSGSDVTRYLLDIGAVDGEAYGLRSADGRPHG
jgi:hypothetical protein